MERDFAARLGQARAALGTASGREWDLGRALPLSSALTLLRGLLDESPAQV